MVEDIRERAEWITANLDEHTTLREILSRQDVIIHCAAKVAFDSKSEKEMYETNVVGTHDLVNLAIDCGVKKFVYISSIAALGKNKNEQPINEEIEWMDDNEQTYYGVTKHLGEREVWRGAAEGMDVTVLNPSLIIGAGYWDRGTCEIVQRLYKGVPFYPTGTTGMVDVRDVARFSVEAVKPNYNGKKFIISAENRSYKDYFDSICIGLGKRKPPFSLGWFWRNVAWRGDKLLSFIIKKPRSVTKEHLISGSKKAFYDNSLSQSAFGRDYIAMEETWATTSSIFLNCKKNKKSFGVMPID